ncbi:hypothetical protein LY78DRAFT_289317 [Colletotrichum sublineola]|nr:hypothetical protein LY78DRAFT_289317 [Colletotrichum sublineola]
MLWHCMAFRIIHACPRSKCLFLAVTLSPLFLIPTEKRYSLNGRVKTTLTPRVTSAWLTQEILCRGDCKQYGPQRGR